MGATKRVHAEVRAVLKAGRKDIRCATIFIFRSNKNGKIGMAKPCTLCEALLRDKGIKNVFYTTSDGTIGESNFTYGVPG